MFMEISAKTNRLQSLLSIKFYSRLLECVIELHLFDQGMEFPELCILQVFTWILI